jgi:ribosomal protein S18 acetylase RimI-like enzyme
MAAYAIRAASLNDVDFIVKSIIEAEKSGSDKLSYSTIFNISEEEVIRILRLILLEEIDGCEFSLSNYLVAETNNKVVGAIGAWVERNDTSSSIIKGNLLGYFLSKSSIVFALEDAKIASELVIDIVRNALSIVVVYISPEHRGKRLFEMITNEHIKRNEGVNELAIQVMANNIYAIKSYERYGFKTCFIKKVDDPRIMQFLPYNEKILMKKTLNNQ